MNTANFIRLVVLAAIWGSSFLFMRISAPVLGPALLIEYRVLFAALFLAAVGFVLMWAATVLVLPALPLFPLPGRFGFFPQTDSEMTDDHGRDKHDEKGPEVLDIRDGKCKPRRDKEKIKAEDA